MTALTAAAIVVRRLFTLGLFLGAALLITAVFYTLGRPVWQSFFPQPTTPPTLAFGRLPPISAQGLPVATNSAGVTFKIETIEGKIPNLPPQAKVYRIAKPPPSLQIYERARIRARNMGFPGGPLPAASDTIRKYTDKDVSQRTLEMHIINGNFVIDTPKTEWQKFSSRDLYLSLNQTAIDIARSYLATHAYLPEDLTPDKIKSVPLKITQDQFGKLELKEANSPPELADFVRVDFYRGDIEKIPIIPLEDNKANISLMISPRLAGGDPQFASNKNLPIILANYTYWPFSNKVFGTYPLKKSQDAFRELQQGKGLILSGKDREIPIKKVYLAYLEEKVESEYLQPVFVFEGQNSQKGFFRAVVPAIESGAQASQ